MAEGWIVVIGGNAKCLYFGYGEMMDITTLILLTVGIGAWIGCMVQLAKYIGRNDGQIDGD